MAEDAASGLDGQESSAVASKVVAIALQPVHRTPCAPSSAEPKAERRPHWTGGEHGAPGAELERSTFKEPMLEEAADDERSP